MKSKSSLSFSSSSKSSTPVSNVSSSSGISSSSSVPSCRSSKLKPQLNSKGKILLFKENRPGIWCIHNLFKNTDLLDGALRVFLENTDQYRPLKAPNARWSLRIYCSLCFCISWSVFLRYTNAFWSVFSKMTLEGPFMRSVCVFYLCICFLKKTLKDSFMWSVFSQRL